MKTILGLDLGTNSIGWAVVKEAEYENEVSSIVDLGVRVNPLTTDEQINFEKGKPITTNANRTLARSARRNLQRFKLRRSNLIEILLQHKFIENQNCLAEIGNNTTFETYRNRALAATEKISLENLAKVLLMINKKRGYKSSRKVTNNEEGSILDGMAVAKALYDANITPGEYSLNLLKENKKNIPDFYRSDLINELNRIWDFQKKYHDDILTEELKKEINGKGQKATSAIFWNKYKINTAEIKGTRDQKKLQAYQWRVDALTLEISKENLAFVITEINNNINNSSGYLGEISDRSKELYFNKLSVGEYLYRQLQENSNCSLRNKVFYRQDYLDEFEKIWECQKKFHTILTTELKNEIRDVIIFYQRKLKSQKNLISICEFEQKEVIISEGKKKFTGFKVCPKSSPLFQEFKIWQNLHNLEFKNKTSKEIKKLLQEDKVQLFNELNIKGRLEISDILQLLRLNPKEWEANYKSIEGNNTNELLYNAFLKIIEFEGYDNEFIRAKNKDDISVKQLKILGTDIRQMIKEIFITLNINTDILHFDAQLDGKQFENQASYQFWHLIYSFEGDNSISGNDKLHEILITKYGFSKDHAKIIAAINFKNEYGSLSTKAIRKIYPYIIENEYSEACALAGYNHSKASITKEENDKRELKNKLDLIKKNDLRNPVVEKILNQMINVVNNLIMVENQKNSSNKSFHFDEIRIELARELKKNASERAEMTNNINRTKAEHEKIQKLLISEFNILNPTRNDIIKYKLYEELKTIGYKDIYTNKYIPREKLFSKEIDIEHIIPQSKLFDDSFSNKTIVYRDVNIDKGNATAYDYISSKFGIDGLNEYINRVELLFNTKESPITKAKYLKLLKKETEIGDGFINRDLRDSQYIAKKAKEILLSITRTVVSTTGSVTDKLREDWGLISVMKELNIEKYRKLGLTEFITMKDGNKKEVIVDWTKRNDHRHHSMDALTVAFTKHNYIQYLNHLNARKDENNKKHDIIHAIEKLETELVVDDLGNKKRRFRVPFEQFRNAAKHKLENIIVSQKAKNKVVTRNINKINTRNGVIQKIELTPRGQLHKETVYGKIQQYQTCEEKVSAKFDFELIQKVANLKYRNLLLHRLAEFENDPKKAFSGNNALIKNPIYLNKNRTIKLPEKVKLVWMETDYTIRKSITPENFKDLKSIDKIIDAGIRKIIKERYISNDSNSIMAFSNLENNPIWLNESKGIAIKSVKISGIKNAEALHVKKDNVGQTISKDDNSKIPSDFVSTGNNHHVAIFIDNDGKYQEQVVSLFEAVARVNAQLPIINKDFNSALGWKFLFTLKQNEYFIFPSNDFNPGEIDILNPENRHIISPHIFRVQKITTKDYTFRHHIETKIEDVKDLSGITWKRVGINSLKNIIKVRINHIGQIVQIGEY